jgi:branched-chain amino acid transport system substrate-binding protein
LGRHAGYGVFFKGKPTMNTLVYSAMPLRACTISIGIASSGASVPNRARLRWAMLFSALSVVGLTGCDAPPSVIKIGVAQPLTGPIAALGQDLVNGVNMAVEELNNEGYTVRGKPVRLEVVVADDRSNADSGKEVAQQLVDAGVLAVIGHLNSGVSIPAAPIYAKSHIAQLAISTNPKFTQLGLDTTYRLVGNDTLQAKAMGAFSASQFAETRYAVVDDGTPYGKDLAAGAVVQLKAKNKEIVLQKSYDDKTTQFDDLATKLKADNVAIVVATLNDFQLLALMDALKKVDYTNIKVLGGDLIKTPLMLKGESTGIGLYATSPILEVSEFPAGAAYLAKYEAKFKVAPSYASHYTYDAMHVLAAAIRRAPTSSAKDIAETLRKFDGYAPVTGSMKWDAAGEQRYGVIGVYKVKNGVWEPQMRSDIW